MKKCKYCNKKTIEDDFCSDDCKNKGERYFLNTHKPQVSEN